MSMRLTVNFTEEVEHEKQIRRGVFETNSSSVHSITLAIMDMIEGEE